MIHETQSNIGGMGKGGNKSADIFFSFVNLSGITLTSPDGGSLVLDACVTRHWSGRVRRFCVEFEIASSVQWSSLSPAVMSSLFVTFFVGFWERQWEIIITLQDLLKNN